MKKMDKKTKKDSSNKLVVLTKKDLVDAIADQLPLMKKTEIQTVLETACNEIVKGVYSNKKVTIRTFGTFLPVKRKSRFGRMFNSSKNIRIPARRQFVFKPSSIIKNID